MFGKIVDFIENRLGIGVYRVLWELVGPVMIPRETFVVRGELCEFDPTLSCSGNCRTSRREKEFRHMNYTMVMHEGALACVWCGSPMS